MVQKDIEHRLARELLQTCLYFNRCQRVVFLIVVVREEWEWRVVGGEMEVVGEMEASVW